MPRVVNILIQLCILTALVFVWTLLGMVYMERFIPPFDMLIPWLVPWKELMTISGKVDSVERFSFMQNLLEVSSVISNVAFVSMIVLFFILTIYITFIYQEKQRRSRENRLLQLKNQEIARRNEFIQFISATIGHEFKNNLGRIKRRIDLLSDLSEKSRQQIQNNLNKLFTDIEIFKDISDKREAGLVDFVKINLVEILEELLKQNNDLADFTIEDNFSPPSIYASQTLMKTVFENLIDNAIKYKKSEQERARITVSFDMDKDGRRRYVAVLFKDEGIGMDKWTADQCFYKGKGSREGWGEGLYFVKYVIGLHAGKIRIGKEYTELGTGAEIIINFPFVEEDMNV